jgi:hypothetical protein
LPILKSPSPQQALKISSSGQSGAPQESLRRGHQVLFLPLYSRDINPIEMGFFQTQSAGHPDAACLI